MLRLLLLLIVAYLLTEVGSASADDPQEETVQLSGTTRVATLAPPSGMAGTGGTIQTVHMSAFQSGGTTPAANVIDNGQIVSPQPPTLADKSIGLNNGDNGAEEVSYAVSPNPQVAPGTDHVVEFAEWLGRVYSKHTLQVAKTFALYDLFSVPTPRCVDGFLQPCWLEGQPRLIFDDFSDRFIATYVSYVNYPSGLDESRLHIAVSATSDPMGDWNIYYHPYTEVYPDEPWVGVTSDKITISSNLVDIDGFNFVGEQSRVYNKSQMLEGASVDVDVYPTTTGYFAVRPAQHMTPGNDQFAAMIQGNNVKVFRYTDSAIRTVSNVTVSGHSAPFDGYDETGFIESGDGRLLDAFVDGSSLWLTTTTDCVFFPASRTCTQIIQINTNTMTVVQNIIDGFSAGHAIYPAARTDASGNLIVVQGLVVSAFRAHAIMLSRGAADPPNTISSFTALQHGEIAVGSSAPASSTPWGSYFSAARDPSNSCVWLVGQYPKDVAGVTGGNDWGTVIARVAHPSVADQCTDYDKDGAVDATDTEDDGDGFLDVNELGSPLCLDSDSDDSFEDTRVNDGCPANGAAEAACTDSLDNDADGAINDGCSAFGAYGEGNWSIGTDPRGRCGAGPGSGASVAWPLDFVSGGTPSSTDKITITDLTSFLAPIRRLDKHPADAGFDKRWDLLPGPAVGQKWIQIGDLTALFAGSGAFPPMSGGQRVFGSSFVCTDIPPP